MAKSSLLSAFTGNFNGSPVKGEDEIAIEPIPFHAFPSQKEAQRDLQTCLCNAKREALKMKLPSKVCQRLEIQNAVDGIRTKAHGAPRRTCLTWDWTIFHD